MEAGFPTHSFGTVSQTIIFRLLICQLWNGAAQIVKSVRVIPAATAGMRSEQQGVYPKPIPQSAAPQKQRFVAKSYLHVGARPTKGQEEKATAQSCKSVLKRNCQPQSFQAFKSGIR